MQYNIIGSRVRGRGIMIGERVEVVFENGVFRPLHPIHLREHQHFTLVLPVPVDAARNGTLADVDEFDDEVGYEPLPLQQRTTIRVRLTPIGELPKMRG
jgi:predicted DNA-binding antitoxin AbrB/MazE fold protein